MKQQTFRQQLWLMLLMLLIPLGAWADREVNQPQFGKQVITVASDEVITFKDPKGDTDYTGQTSENAQSLTVFQPAEAGMSVQITFESMNMGGSGSYYSFANVYSGDPDADNTFAWATSTSEVPTSYSESNLPSGDILRTYPNERNQTYTNEAYVSAAADGSLSVGFAYRYAYSCTGWVAKVKVVKLENMTITGAGSSYEGVSNELTSKQNVPLANAYVTATGVMNPDNVTGIYFTMTQNEGAVDPTTLKLYKGTTQVEATVAADGDGYKFTLNEAPVDGTTTFTIKGNFLSTAAVGAKVQVDVTKITTAAIADGITPFTAGTSVVITNPALVIMTATPQTVTVGETALQFYDEGGKDGGIQAKTNGQVTFLSGDSDKKVMVDFTTNSIWHGSLYNQELRIYNGQEVDASNLLKTLQQGETGIVRSTAADGSLTVVLYSDTGSTTAADGFEATVSLFTPQAMDFNGAPTAVAASEETVCAGDTEQDMLTITVKAKDTEPAMQVTKMSFLAGESYALVSKATLFFGSTKVGETVVEGSAFDITLTTPQTLVEGDNTFTLKYDISDEAMNNDKVSAKLTSVTATVNSAEKAETATDDATERTVKNIVLNYADQGTVTKTVNGSLAFETKPTSEYSTKYEYGSDTRTNIFVPKHAGMVCQIDFSSFAVYYASSSWGTKAKFEIYAGQGTTGDLLWELNDNAQQNVGPDTVIRSTAADGALTVVFSPNTSYSSYTLDGWKATVSEYQSKPMEVKETEVTQASTADASIGAAGQELLSVNVKTEGDQSPLTMGGMKLNLNGTEANWSKVSIWQDATLLGEATAAAEVDVTFGEAFTLAEGDNVFSIKADVSEDAVENQTIDAKVISVKVGSDDVPVASGDPEGARTLKNQVLMTEGNHGTLNLGLGKTVALYDDGGPEGDGAKVNEAIVTLAPTGDADCIKLTGLSFSLNYVAKLSIYKGGEVNEEKLITTYSGTSIKFAPYISDSKEDGGKLTIKYVYTGSSAVNFAIQAEGYKKTNVVVTGVTTEDISVNEVLKGQTDVKMLKVMVEAQGELNSAMITAFDITGADGEAVNGYHIYQTGTTTTFSANEAFATEYEITNTGIYYFWITYDVKTDATVGLTASATLNSITVGEETIDVTEPVTATITVASGKSGTYTVGQDGDYATIQGAVDKLGILGMEGPVTLKIKAGEYNEKVRIPYIKGMGAVNTLTLESESGQRDVKIYHNQYTTGDYSDDQYSKVYGVVTLFEASYVTLKNLEITTTDLNYKAVVMVKDESRHATIDNCYLHTDIYASTSGDGPALVGHTIIDEENRNNDYLTVRNCLLEGGKYGVYMGGTSTVALPKEVGGVIEGNTFKNNGRFMLYSYDELGAKIRNNTFVIDNADVKMSNGVIDINVRDEHSSATEITGNIFHLASSNTLTAIYVRQMEATTDAPAIIANNVVNLASANASCSPFKFNSGKIKNTNVAHNTFRMTGTNGGAAFWASSALADGYGNVNVVNNIIQNETNGYAVNLYSDANLDASKINFQNNVMYTAGETFFRAASSTSGDFAAFVEKTSATGCVNKQVTFVTDDILLPENTLDGDLLKASALSYVTTDVTGKERPTENISIGAYEYAEDVVPTMADGYPQATSVTHEGAAIVVKTDAMGKAFVIVKKSSETAPTLEELAASENTVTLSADTEAQLNISSLDELTEYTAYVLLQSPAGQQATEAKTVTFSTPKTPAPAPVVVLYADDQSNTEATIPLGEATTLYAMMTDGEAPYTVTWTDTKHNVLKSETLETLPTDLLTLDVTPTECTDYTITISDSRNMTATATVRIYTTSDNLLVADFENLYLEDNSWENGKNLPLGSFVSGSFKFDNYYSPDYGGYWGNYGYANRTSTTFENMISDQFNNAVGGGVNGSENYMVAYPTTWYGSNVITVMNKPEGDVISGFYITNDAWVVDNIVNGDGMSSDDGAPFGKGDYLKLTITADNGNTVDYYLADYRSEDQSEHYYVNAWQWVDLTSLGTVKTLSFTLTGTKKNSYGLTTATYFCMDDLGGTPPTTDGLHPSPSTLHPSPIEGYYDLNGRRLAIPQKGVNIVKMKNGSVKKIMK